MKLITFFAAIVLATSAGSAFAEVNLKKGEKTFKKCKSCHMVGDKAKHKSGPILNDIFGRQAGTAEGFEKKYSKAMKKVSAEGLLWTEDNLRLFLKKPKKFLKGTRMGFSGLKDKDMDNLIAYLKQYSKDIEEKAAE